MGIFNIDNKFFRALNKLVDMVILSFCWIISCIPVFTIGAASTALYDTSRRVIHHDEGYVWRGYWHAFKVNFKQATKAWLVQLIILIVLLEDIYITWSGLKTGNQWGNLLHRVHHNGTYRRSLGHIHISVYFTI